MNRIPTVSIIMTTILVLYKTKEVKTHSKITIVNSRVNIALFFLNFKL